jgi:hypothetical protein
MDLNEIAKEIREIISSRQKELGLTFKEDTHTYTMVGKTDFPSVSKVMKLFYDEFPTEEAAYNKAKGDVLKQQELIEQWVAAGLYSTNLGSRVHFILEKRAIEMFGGYKEVRQPIFECDLEQIMKSDNMVNAGLKYLLLMKDRGAVLLDTEIVLGDPILGYTGQPDKVWLIFNRSMDKIGIVITDWKSNKPKNFQETKFTKRMKHPFDGYPDTALGHYYLQLPLYGRLLLQMLKGTKYENIELFGCLISHLKEDGTYDEYRVPKDVIQKVFNIDFSNYLNK